MNSQAEWPRLAVYGPAKTKKRAVKAGFAQRVQSERNCSGPPAQAPVKVPEGFEFWKRVEFDSSSGGRIFGGRRTAAASKPHPPVAEMV